MAYECNQIWNHANEESANYAWVPIPEIGYVNLQTSAFDIQKTAKLVRTERNFIIHSTSAQEIVAVHAKSRKQFHKNKLRWRVSGGSKRSLGWVPFKKGAVSWKNGQAYYAGHYFNVWDSYGLSKYHFTAGSFSEDSRGRWYLNIVVELPIQPLEEDQTKDIGIDLGLKNALTTSESVSYPAPRIYRNLQEKLGKAQRAKKKERVRAIHAKIKNKRKDWGHQVSAQLVRENAAIFVGDVSPSALGRTKMAKSVYDVGWAQFKTKLSYKAKAHSVWFDVVSEKYTTQTCSCCGKIPPSSPKGRAGLGIREWVCSLCGALHDRDVNSAKLVRAAGHCRLVAGIPAL